jgi:hypothetical protein
VNVGGAIASEYAVELHNYCAALDFGAASQMI